MLPLTHVGNHVGGKSGGKPQVLFPHTTLLQGILTGSNPSKLISLYHPRQEMGSPSPQILYGKLPALGTMVLFCLLLGVFAIGAPGVPGGTVMASLGLIISVLGFDDTGTALMLTIFALQDSFGTACNVTGDGALTLMLTGYARKHKIEEIKNTDIL